ncbi:ISAs1 family transposase [bacterium AH-315-K03]|nr:ISAs1 family transposase [bacterium AH-315-K03]
MEQRKTWLVSDVDWLIERHPQWQSIKGIVLVDSTREVPGVVSNEQRYYITSHTEKTAEFIAYAIRNYWSVENKLHWQLDSSFNEDRNHLRSGYAAESLALMNKVALNLLKNERSANVGVKNKRLKAGWYNNDMLIVLTVGSLSV